MISLVLEMRINAEGSSSLIKLRSRTACGRFSAVKMTYLSFPENAPCAWQTVALRFNSCTIKSQIGFGLSHTTLKYLERLKLSIKVSIINERIAAAVKGAGIDIYVPKTEDNDVVVNYVDEQKKTASLYDSSKLNSRDKYAVYLGGNFSVVDIRTVSESNRRLLLIKDSYANSFVPFLTPYFREIVMVDPRYYSGTIGDIMDTYEITDTLFLYIATVLSVYGIPCVWQTDRSSFFRRCIFCILCFFYKHPVVF